MERGECSGCGHPLETSTDPANRGHWDVKRRTCEACLVLEASVASDHQDGKQPRGVKYLTVLEK